MKTRPSIAFDSFSGSAGNVTARKVDDKTYLSSRVKHSKIKTPAQALRRCRFSETTRGYSKITEDQRREWISLAQSLGTYSTSTGPVSMTGHNLFVAINTYRKICGKQQRDSAPSELRPSRYVAFDDLWLTPEHVVFTGLRQSENPDDMLLIEMYPATSNGATKSWNKTVIVAVRPGADWGDIDISQVFLERFGYLLSIGQLVFIKICWIDSECGYLKLFTLLSLKVTENDSQRRSQEYAPRAQVTSENVIETEYFKSENFDYEYSPGSKIVSNDITSKVIYLASLGVTFPQKGLPYGLFIFERTYQLARGTEEHAYTMICIETLIQNYASEKTIQLNWRAGVFRKHFETFGTYYVTM